jgi:hypothetical protein
MIVLKRSQIIGSFRGIERFFARKKAKTIRIVERDEYDLKTVVQLMKSDTVSHIDESIDVCIK